MSKAPRLVPNSNDVIRANKIFDLINCSKSIQTNKCPLLRSGFVWPLVKLSDILPVNTFELDMLYTKQEFKILAQKSVISPKEEYDAERADSIKDYFQRKKGSFASLSNFLSKLLKGKQYVQLTDRQKEDLIFQMFACTNATQIQLVLLLDEDKEYIKDLYMKYKLSTTL